VVSNERVLKWM